MDIPALITAVAAIFAAIAWPLIVLIILLSYRKPLSSFAMKIPSVVDRIQTVKIGALEAELNRVALANGDDAKGAITPEQVQVAIKIESQVSDLGLPELLRQLDRLCLEYDTIRNALPSGYQRTAAMTNILIKMRALAPSISLKIDTFKSSGSPGSRLAAIAMMQMEPQLGDLEWLGQRFSTENPFIFYHAALALKNMTIQADPQLRAEISAVATAARAVVENFEYGVPDPDTIEALSSIE